MDDICAMLGSANIHDLNNRWPVLFRVKEGLASREETVEFVNALIFWAHDKYVTNPGMNDAIASLRHVDPDRDWCTYILIVTEVTREMYKCVSAQRAECDI